MLDGKTKTIKRNLYFSSGGAEGEWAVRSGDWKIVALRDQIELFNLDKDPSEENDLKEKYPKKVAELTKLYDAWLDEMAEPASGAGKRWRKNAPAPTKKQKLHKRAERKEQRTNRNR